MEQAPHNTRDKLLMAAIQLTRARGFEATTVDDLWTMDPQGAMFALVSLTK